MGVEKNNEITVKINGNFNKVIELLVNKGFEITDKFSLEDIYLIPKDMNIKESSVREILKEAIIIRNVGRCKVLVFKKKNIDRLGNIISQEKIECDILNIDDARRFIEAIGYKEIMEIAEDDVCYSKDGLGLVLKNVRNGDNLIEVETIDEDGLRTIEDLKEKMLELKLPIDTSDFFVKKAEVELEKVINKYKNKAGTL